MKSDTIGDIQDKAFMCVTIFGGLRTQSVHDIKSKDVVFVNATLSVPRYIQLTTDTSKNDRSGEGDVENRRHRIGKFVFMVTIYVGVFY